LLFPSSSVCTTLPVLYISLSIFSLCMSIFLAGLGCLSVSVCGLQNKNMFSFCSSSLSLSLSLSTDMHIFDHLKHLESYLDHLKHLEGKLSTEKNRGERMSKLYELVQYAGNILPRLYLLVTVGAAYINSKEAPAKDILQDLVEMTKGVQHPLRGLFLRNYLAEMTRNKLPDLDNPFAQSGGGTTEDSIDFVLANFTEMNKLWVRMQPPQRGGVKQRERREQERKDLRLLVGKTLATLARLDGLTEDTYTSVVFPRIVNQIISCNDLIAQEYLMECVVQIFPDEFHLPTVSQLLDACAKLVDGVNIKQIIGRCACFLDVVMLCVCVCV
jgi:vacuolar protein sorting-associated protein 35